MQFGKVPTLKEGGAESRTSLQNQHLWGRGGQNHGKLNIFDLFYWPKYSAHVLLDFPDPKTDQPIVDSKKPVSKIPKSRSKKSFKILKSDAQIDT